MLNAYHITLIIPIPYSCGLATFICACHNSSFVPFVRVSHNSPFCPLFVLYHCFGATSDLCVPTGNSYVKVEWTLLSSPIYKSRCGARTMSHVHPRSAPVRVQAAQLSQWSRYRCCGCAVLTRYRCLVAAM
jgi:hypothetical protein